MLILSVHSSGSFRLGNRPETARGTIENEMHRRYDIR
jgi:hypothetical protein